MSNADVIYPEFDRPLSEDAERSWTLPARYYFDPAIFGAEREKIFFKSWQYVGHKSQVANPGDFITGYVVDQPVFVLRDRAGELKGYYNVCLHRAHELLKGAGSLRSAAITCPYHAWAYDFEGTLRAAPNTKQVKDFNPEDFKLTPIRVEMFAGFVFVNLDPGAKPMKDQVGWLADDLRKHVPDFDNLKLYEAMPIGNAVTKANWKVVVDNYVECYHCPKAHPAFADMIEMTEYKTDIIGPVSRQLGLNTRPKNSAYEFSPDAPVTHAAFWFLWPNITFNMMPGETQLAVAVVQPKGVEECVFWSHIYRHKAEADPAKLAYGRTVLGPEDNELCESVQRGLHARVYNQGRIIVDPERSGIGEHGIHHFHRMVKAALDR
jgi:phenylpropionate dioxygenase-like ring-hydroxylating dioxygenase large terminal subunit